MTDPFSDDPFGDFEVVANFESTPSPDVMADGTRVLLPLGLAILTLFGAFLPWVIVRPLGDRRLTYNLTDAKGGMGILVTAGFFVLLGAVLIAVNQQFGLIAMAIASSAIGWLATISGLLLSVVGSLIPDFKVAGIDLTKAQVGQGPGVVIAVVSSLILGILTVRKYPPIDSMSPSMSIRVLPIAAIIPMIVIVVNHHAGWLMLGEESGKYAAEIPGDALYGSGLLLVGLYLCTGMWFVALVLRTPAITAVTSAVTVLIGLFTGLFAILVWLGGNGLQWLLPQSMDGWASVSTELPLYLSLIAAIVLVIVGAIGFVPQMQKIEIRFGQGVDIGRSRISTSDIVGALIILGIIIATMLRALG